MRFNLLKSGVKRTLFFKCNSRLHIRSATLLRALFLGYYLQAITILVLFLRDDCLSYLFDLNLQKAI